MALTLKEWFERELRISGMLPTDVARKAGVAPSTATRVIRDGAGLSQGTALKFAKAMRTTVPPELLDAIPEKAGRRRDNADTHREGHLDLSGGRASFLVPRAMTEEDREKVLKFVAGMLNVPR